MPNLPVISWALGIYAVLGLGSMATMSIGAIIVFAALLMALGPAGFFSALTDEIRRPAGRRYFRISISLAGFCLLTMAVAMVHPLTYGGKSTHIDFASALAKSWYFIWPLVLLVGLRRLDEIARARVLRAWLLAAGVFSVIGIAQHFTGWPRPQLIPPGDRGYHATIFLGHHLSVANVFIFPFFAALDLWRQNDRRLALPRWTLAAIALLVAAALFLSYSRILWVALPAGLVVWALISLPRRFKIAAVAVVLAGLAVIWQSEGVRTRLQYGVGDRQPLWEANWEFFKQRPLTGVGWRQNQELSGYYLMEKTGAESVFSGHAHNSLLEMLSSTGLIGASLWLLWCGWVIALLWRNRGARTVGFPLGLLAAWFVFHLNGLTQVNFWEAKVQHQMMWMVAWTLLWVTKDNEAAHSH